MLSGCAARTSATVDPVDDFVQRDSAGVLILEASGVLARAHLSWEAQPDPELEIGVFDGAPENAFHVINAILELEDGRPAVSDAATGEIRYFGQGASCLYTVGVGGAGSEEFRSPRVVPALQLR